MCATMTNQGRVRSRYPNASAEQERTGEWRVWDINRDERKRFNTTRGLFGLGRTEEEAWADAVRVIECREGIKLPII